MARAIYNNQVPPLRLGFSPFVNTPLLQALRLAYEELFPACEIQLSSGDTAHTLHRLGHGGLDCAILPLPVDRDLWTVLQVAQSPLVLCMRADDPLAARAQVDLHEAAPRIKIFRDPELHSAAHSRLSEMFAEAGIPLNLANSAATPTDMQWMVKEGYGLALIDQLSSLEPGLITRPITGANWTADTAFVTITFCGSKPRETTPVFTLLATVTCCAKPWHSWKRSSRHTTSSACGSGPL